MRAILILLLIAFAYSMPNPVYILRKCFEKSCDTKSNLEASSAATSALLRWKLDEFYARVNQIDPELKPKIEQCYDDVMKQIKIRPGIKA